MAAMSDRPGTDRPILIAPSVLPADLSRLGDAVTALDEAGVDRIQWDVMDGRFVPNLTFGPDVIASCRDRTDLLFEAHLMVEDPRSEEHTSELQSLMRISYAVFCLKKQNQEENKRK